MTLQTSKGHILLYINRTYCIVRTIMVQHLFLENILVLALVYFPIVIKDSHCSLFLFLSYSIFFCQARALTNGTSQSSSSSLGGTEGEGISQTRDGWHI